MKLWKVKFFMGKYEEGTFYSFVIAKNAKEARKFVEENIFTLSGIGEMRFVSAVEVEIGDSARLLCTCLEDDLGEEEKEDNLEEED